MSYNKVLDVTVSRQISQDVSWTWSSYICSSPSQEAVKNTLRMFRFWRPS